MSATPKRNNGHFQAGSDSRRWSKRRLGADGERCTLPQHTPDDEETLLPLAASENERGNAMRLTRPIAVASSRRKAPQIPGATIAPQKSDAEGKAFEIHFLLLSPARPQTLASVTSKKRVAQARVSSRCYRWGHAF